MSCDWDIYCRTCCEDMGAFNINHGEETLLDFLEMRPELEALGLALLRRDAQVDERKFPGFTKVEISGFLDYPRREFNFRWFGRHAGHNVGLRNEFGQFSEQCRKIVSCTHCEGRLLCKLKPGHTGECQVKPQG